MHVVFTVGRRSITSIKSSSQMVFAQDECVYILCFSATKALKSHNLASDSDCKCTTPFLFLFCYRTASKMCQHARPSPLFLSLSIPSFALLSFVVCAAMVLLCVAVAKRFKESSSFSRRIWLWHFQNIFHPILHTLAFGNYLWFTLSVH